MRASSEPPSTCMRVKAPVDTIFTSHQRLPSIQNDDKFYLQYDSSHSLTEQLLKMTILRNIDESSEARLFVRVLVVVLGVAILVPYLYFRAEGKGINRVPLPPTPPGNFITGNLSEVLAAVSKNQQHLLFNEWAQQYGEIVRVRSGPFVQYFINSDKAVKEIFDRNSAFTSQRPRWIASNEQICNGMNLLLLDGDHPRWKHQRKVTHNYLTSVPRADAGLPFLHFESAKFLHRVASEADITAMSGWKLYRSILRYTYSMFASQTFGLDIPEDDDQVIADIHETGLAQILQTLPGANLVDPLPILDKLPLVLKPWERRNRKRFTRDMDFVKEKLNRIRQLRARGVTSDAFLPLIEAENKGSEFGAGIDEAAYLSLMLVIGAADTSAVSTWSFMEAMLMFPTVQTKARRLITQMIGDRIPTYEDIDRIPYVRCLMKETWRWRPPVALGHPHITTRDLIYNEMRIPAGSQIHLNAYAVQHDPTRHPNPDQFFPERFENDLTTTMQSINAKDVRDRDHFAFGAGRRICPGYHVAERSLAVAIMRILWAFEIVPSSDARMPLDPLAFEGGMMPGIADKRMPVCFKLVSEQRREHINVAFEQAVSERRSMEPLVVEETGQGAFERLGFVNYDEH
ncbi:hypothetical protein LTR05_007999 [Lithohypha guttulata]|uniref:Cytochrome P450 n=1 Tax=Lithohypha guttulata TaxID=1690604 RepID=A0AAN7STL8_9EURO|nr:hypothetical protein LTR05_007999 [Lithohypha guttulata]